MDPITNHSQDFLIVIILPLMFVTIKNAWQYRHTLWDADVTAHDRDLFMRITMFVVMPVIVFLHECGHAAAILLFGGKIAEFHYGILWGYVVPSGLFTPEQILIIFLAGNVVEMLCGALALAFAPFIKSPPVVALLVYTGIWSISGTAIVYALMSVMGMYGDWIAIYTTPVRSWIPYIATIHGIIVIALLYAIYSKRMKLWFTARTRPNWYTRLQGLLEQIKAAPSADLYLDLGWLYYEVGLSGFAQDAANQSIALNPQFVDPLYLKSWIKVSLNKVHEAQIELTELSRNEHATPILKARALMSVGQLEEDQIAIRSRGGKAPPEMWKLPLEAFTAASQLMPELGDPKFYRARALNKAGLHTMALDELEELQETKWLDSRLPEQVQTEILLARKLSSPPQ